MRALAFFAIVSTWGCGTVGMEEEVGEDAASVVDVPPSAVDGGVTAADGAPIVVDAAPTIVDAARPDSCPGPLGPGDGNYLMATKVVTNYYQFLANFVEDECQQTITLTVTPLNATDRTPVGSSLSVGTIPYAGGSFTISIGTIVIPAAASPTGQSITINNLVLAGELRADRICGTITQGQVVSPFSWDLAGAPWGAIPATTPLPAPDETCP